MAIIAAASVLAAGAAAAAVVVLTRHAPADGPRVVQPGAPGQPGRTLSRDDLTTFAPPTHTPADARFMQRMIAHHEQALAMTALVDGGDAGADVRLLAGRIEISQREEIAQMRRWLTDRGEATGHAHHGEPMPGMASAEQLDRLRRARGAEFDRTFLQLMIAHHEGALEMVRELYAAGGGLEPACDRFAREVNADQSIEIARMRALLAT